MGNLSNRSGLGTVLGLAGVAACTSLLVVVVPLFFWLDHGVGLTQAWIEAGWAVYALAGMTLLSVVALLGLAAWFGQSPKSWSWTPALVVSSIAIVGITGVMLARQQIDGALTMASVELLALLRIRTEGLSEWLRLYVFMGLFGAVTAAAASTLPAARSLRRVEKTGRGWQVWIALLLGLLGLGVTIAIGVLLKHLSVRIVMLVVGLVGVVGVSMATSSTLAHREGDNDPAGALGDLLLVGLLSSVGLAFAVQAQSAMSLSKSLHATTGLGGTLLTNVGARLLGQALVVEIPSTRTLGLMVMGTVWLAALPILSTRLSPLGRAVLRVWGGLVGTVLVAVLVAFVPSVQTANALDELAHVIAPAPPESFRLIELKSPVGSTRYRGPVNAWLTTSGLIEAGTSGAHALDLRSEASCKRAADAVGIRSQPRQPDSPDKVVVAIAPDVPYERVACLLSQGNTSPLTQPATNPRDRSVEPGGAFERTVFMAAKLPATDEPSPALPSPFDGFRDVPPAVAVHFSGLPRSAPGVPHLHVDGSTIQLLRPYADKPTPLRARDLGKLAPESFSQFEPKPHGPRTVDIPDDSQIKAMKKGFLGDRPGKKIKPELLLTATAHTPFSRVLQVYVGIPRDYRVVLGAPLPKLEPRTSVEPSASSTSPSSPGAIIPPSSKGGLAPELTKRVIRNHQASFRRCYETALRNTPSLEGKVVISFTIERNGSVSRVTDYGSNISDATVRECVMTAVRRMRFPSSEDTTHVVLPLTFTQAN